MARRAKEKATDSKADGDEAPRRGASRASRGATRGIWSGSISFGLLQIPVALVPAESRSEELHFRMLDKRDLSPIRYERVSASSGKKVDWDDIVKGYEIEKGNFVIVEPEDFEKANVKATQTIDIQDFVPADQIDPAFFETPYYVVPQARAVKAYVLLREALQRKKAVAVATFVLRTREHLVAVMPVGEALMLEVMRFGHQLKDASDITLPNRADAKALGDRELSMAEQLIEGMLVDWDPKKYKDHYYGDVMKIIEEKARTGEATAHHTETRGTMAHDGVVDLLDLLKKSVERSGRAANDERATPKKAAKRGAKKRRAA